MDPDRSARAKNISAREGVALAADHAQDGPPRHVLGARSIICDPYILIPALILEKGDSQIALRNRSGRQGCC